MFSYIVLILLLINIGVETRAKKRSTILYVLLALILWFGSQELILYLLGDVLKFEEPSEGFNAILVSVVSILLCLGLYGFLKSRKTPE
ncbi:MAG: hypothetical protein R8P61_22020 [Bacteroidia bacterium]|nr:hypothetical protein [Bacteroidia bacterium]